MRSLFFALPPLLKVIALTAVLLGSIAVLAVALAVSM